MADSPTQAEAEVLADEFKRLVLARTGIAERELKCPREKSEMTPCLARDGKLVVVFNSFGHPLCVGCEAFLMPLLESERQKAS